MHAFQMGSPAERVRVLVVDDDTAMLALLAEVLLDEGYAVFQARDGGEALEVLGDHHDGADVVVMDHRMPKVTGLEALILLREALGRTPVVLVSAFADATMEREAGRLGVARVFPKPFSLAELLQVLREVVPPPTTVGA